MNFTNFHERVPAGRKFSRLTREFVKICEIRDCLLTCYYRFFRKLFSIQSVF